MNNGLIIVTALIFFAWIPDAICKQKIPDLKC